MIGMDTSAVIDLFKGDPAIKRFLDRNKEPLAVTIMSYLELFFGLDMNRHAHAEEGKYYKEFFSSVYNLELTKDSCEKASEIYQSLKKGGKTIGQFDCIIAAILLENGIAKILTRYVKDFEKVAKLSAVGY